MRHVATDELAYLIFSGLRSWTPSMRSDLARGTSISIYERAAERVVRAFYKCVFQSEEGGPTLSNDELTAMVASLAKGLPKGRKQAIASSNPKESNPARRATAIEWAAVLDNLWITRDSPALGFPYPPLDGKPLRIVYEEVKPNE
ncbi:hypothetical protein U1769_00845 [Sphingomonas sp. ZT3P38]|uniref:hypothetical protein n=1 Tax=Parasphingomonas zepuensis TaxID=3096161 RepID=UPI002FC5FE05